MIHYISCRCEPGVTDPACARLSKLRGDGCARCYAPGWLTDRPDGAICHREPIHLEPVPVAWLEAGRLVLRPHADEQDGPLCPTCWDAAERAAHNGGWPLRDALEVEP